MNRYTASSRPDWPTIEAALTLAVRAPSIHNTQPWRWRVGDQSVHLYADTARQLSAADPDQRELLLSCGAALHHARVAFAALGWASLVHRLPNPAEPDHLAAIELVTHRPTASEVALSAAIPRRRTDRRRYGDWPLPAGHMQLLIERAAGYGSVLRRIEPGPAHARLSWALHAAAQAHLNSPAYRSELAAWSGRHAATDGVPARNATFGRAGDEFPARHFSAPVLRDPGRGPDGAALLALGTASDDRLSRLRAGEALSATLLTAANIGLASCLITEPLEMPDIRAAVRRDVLGDGAFPMAVLRIGWAPAGAGPIPSTPRRPLRDVLDPIESVTS
ncbi:MAG: NAD(P)H nitroreductase [Mycobacteriaceae bacterium]|nr:NAD(P)H nitroreductase [Mycobacteriaceae bacterium]